jgi:ABC-type glycerol-3-phosphate transport system substrate-binding protein
MELRRIRKSRKVGSAAIVVWVFICFGITGASNRISLIGTSATWGPELDQSLEVFTARTGIDTELLQIVDWSELLPKLITMTAGGIAPDLVYGDSIRIMEMAESGLLTALEGFIATSLINLKNYPPAVLEALRVRGQLYSLPTALSIHATFYNKDQFSKGGVDVLPTNWLGDALGWNEFVAIAKKLTVDRDGDGVPEQYGLGGFGSSYGGFRHLGMWNADDVDHDRTRYLGNTPEVIRALTFAAGLWVEHNVVGGNFLQGTAAMLPIQPYYLNNMVQATEQGTAPSWSLGILPKGDVRASQSSFHSIGMVAASKNVTQAGQLLRFLAYDPEGVILFTRAENRVPAIREAVRDYVQRWSERAPGCNPQVFTEAVNVLWSWRISHGKGADQILKLMTQAWGLIRTGQKSVADAITFIEPGVQAVLGDK